MNPDETIRLNSASNPWFWGRMALNVGMPVVFFIIAIYLLYSMDHPLKYQFMAVMGALMLILIGYFAWCAIPETAVIGPPGVEIHHGPIHRKAGWGDIEKIASARILTSMGKHIRTRSALVYRGKGWKYTLSSAKHNEEELRSAFYRSVMWALATNGRIKVEDEMHWM